MANSLYHHGIQGMKWGKRNGPPYPLKPSARSAAERRANKVTTRDRMSGGINHIKQKRESIRSMMRDGIEAAKTTSEIARATTARPESIPRKNSAQIKAEQDKLRDMINRGTLTEEELRSKIQRLKLEKELRELTENEIDPGRRYVNDILKQVGTGIAVPALKGTGLYTLKAIFSREFSGKELGSAIFNGGPKKK